ncbi:hypothetical protein [Nonlabens ponticola]|uniref:hypothetical protein n=1 Tax=Nonlabens ponticola TaxID=2496866 RepID=UPI0013DF8332|nr:hypothetical protein [Nonlabens ponticola]
MQIERLPRQINQANKREVKRNFLIHDVCPIDASHYKDEAIVQQQELEVGWWSIHQE